MSLLTALIMLFSATIFLVSAVLRLKKAVTKSEGEKQLEDIQDEYFQLSDKDPDDISVEEADRLLEEKEPDFSELEDHDV